MGIAGLLPLLKSIHNYKHISELSGQTIAVDAYVWLHRGAYGCAKELVVGTPTTKFVDYAMHRVRMMRYHNVEPFLVFDGGPLPAKRGTDVERKRKRQEARSMADKLTAQGRHKEAREYYLKCVDITPQIAFQLIKALRAESVSYVVAPYEADAQLLHLEHTGIVNGIMTEDSDLLVFGAKNVYFKFDASSSNSGSGKIADGHCIHITREQFGTVKELNLVGWTDKEFRHMAMLSGCDYLPKSAPVNNTSDPTSNQTNDDQNTYTIKGLGLKTSHKLLRKYKTVERVLKMISLGESTGGGGKKTKGNHMVVPQGYLEKFKMAELAFLYQRVWDPVEEKLVYLRGVDSPSGEWNEEKEQYIGADILPEIARKLALGDICPITHKPMVDINPRYAPSAPKSSLPSKGKNLLPKQDINAQSPTMLDRFFSRKGGNKKGSDDQAAVNTIHVTPTTTEATTSKSASSKKLLPDLSVLTGVRSGKRTLAGESERARERRLSLQRKEEEKEAKLVPEVCDENNNEKRQSRFFGSTSIGIKRKRIDFEENEGGTFELVADNASEQLDSNNLDRPGLKDPPYDALGPNDDTNDDRGFDTDATSLVVELDGVDLLEFSVIDFDFEETAEEQQVEQEKGYVSATDSVQCSSLSYDSDQEVKEGNIYGALKPAGNPFASEVSPTENKPLTRTLVVDTPPAPQTLKRCLDLANIERLQPLSYLSHPQPASPSRSRDNRNSSIIQVQEEEFVLAPDLEDVFLVTDTDPAKASTSQDRSTSGTSAITSNSETTIERDTLLLAREEIIQLQDHPSVRADCVPESDWGVAESVCEDADDEGYADDEDEDEIRAAQERVNTIAQAWRARFAIGPVATKIQSHRNQLQQPRKEETTGRSGSVKRKRPSGLSSSQKRKSRLIRRETDLSPTLERRKQRIQMNQARDAPAQSPLLPLQPLDFNTPPPSSRETGGAKQILELYEPIAQHPLDGMPIGKRARLSVPNSSSNPLLMARVSPMRARKSIAVSSIKSPERGKVDDDDSLRAQSRLDVFRYVP